MRTVVATAATTTLFIGVVFSSSVNADSAVDFSFLNNDTADVQPKKHQSKAGKCHAADTDKLEEQGLFHSQGGQDRCLVEHYFPGICGGRYIEVGALDGDHYSNTYAFYNSPDLGWKGVNIEIDPKSYERLATNRKNDIANIHAAVCSEPPDVTIHYSPGKFAAVGGVWEFASESRRERWWPNTTLSDTMPVHCTPLQTILDHAVGTGSHYFDFMTLIVEGAELSALRGLDFDRVGFGVIIVKKQGRTERGKELEAKVQELLSDAGYDRVDDRTKTCGFRDNWFINRDFESIYKRYREEEELDEPAGSRQLRGYMSSFF
eukprot:CAMPEP_0196154810 /NCGR_PEP_ID=MMETSP0910-20130528/39576_1 /TAXON_ID=49265 /ORGANISM="Thalassiosira rotula, Strain GSO102" /LENGTH=318 /DNA_ID=CAMNT_0041418901 /DNA_START=94 /DNA_END=1050 /DNA_ORIENTATION=+